MRQLGQGIDRDLFPLSKPLTVTVRLVESDALDAERCECLFGVPLWNRYWSKVAAVGLTEYKPSGFVNKDREGRFFGAFVVVGRFIVAALPG